MSPWGLVFEGLKDFLETVIFSFVSAAAVFNFFIVCFCDWFLANLGVSRLALLCHLLLLIVTHRIDNISSWKKVQSYNQIQVNFILCSLSTGKGRK